PAPVSGGGGGRSAQKPNRNSAGGGGGWEGRGEKQSEERARGRGTPRGPAGGGRGGCGGGRRAAWHRPARRRRTRPGEPGAGKRHPRARRPARQSLLAWAHASPILLGQPLLLAFFPPVVCEPVMLPSAFRRMASERAWSVTTRETVSAPIRVNAATIARLLAS